MPLIWIVPEDQGGIRSYADELWPEVQGLAHKSGFATLEPIYDPLTSRREVAKSLRKLQDLSPSLIHVQHEYGLFGRKVPPWYTFPAWSRALRQVLPRTKIVATAHTVLEPGFRYPVQGRQLQVPLRWLANKVVLPGLLNYWGRSTWGGLEGVIVHSALQSPSVRASGCMAIEVIPHLVPRASVIGHGEGRLLVVFGYISPEKGQDVVIRALSKLPSDVKLVLAGGIRRSEDRGYLKKCQAIVRELGLGGRVEFTGFVPADQVDSIYGRAALVIAPFRETSGSGSLVQGFARGLPILASDLPLNRDINEREPNVLALFRTEDPDDCARQIIRLLDHPSDRERLHQAAQRYAGKWSACHVAQMHVSFYSHILERTLRAPRETLENG